MSRLFRYVLILTAEFLRVAVGGSVLGLVLGWAISRLIANWQPIVWVIGSVLLAHAVVIYGLGWITGRLTEPISIRWRHIMAWGGEAPTLQEARVLLRNVSQSGRT